jgi:hypothetical protein
MRPKNRKRVWDILDKSVREMPHCEKGVLRLYKQLGRITAGRKPIVRNGNRPLVETLKTNDLRRAFRRDETNSRAFTQTELSRVRLGKRVRRRWRSSDLFERYAVQ